MEYEYVQMTLDDWVRMKEQLKEDLIGVQESFVRIGFLLRRIKEQELYKKDGYATIAEFAKAEHGLEAPTVSRFIKINERYSVDGYSDRLRPEYARMGSSKLAEMLSLPDGDLEMIRPEATRENIRELKQFNKVEPAADSETGYRDLVESFFKDNQDLLKEVYAAGINKEPSRLAEIVNPGGNRSYRKGIFFLMMYENEIKIKKFGSDAPETMSWAEFFSLVKEIYGEGLQKEEKPGESANEETEPESVPAKAPEDEVTEKTDHFEDVDKTAADVSEETEDPEPDEDISDTVPDEPGEEIAPAQFSAESLNENGISELEEPSEIPPKTVEETAGVMEADSDPADQPEEPEEESQKESPEKPAGQQAPVKTYTRKQHLNKLSEVEAADYISKEYKQHSISALWLNSPSKLKKWLERKVDEAGNEV